MRTFVGDDAHFGGAYSHSYVYDDINRLISANGKAKTASFHLDMSYGIMGEPLTKKQKVDSSKVAQSCAFAYLYEDSKHPTAPTQIGHDHYTYDANGNPTLVTNDSTNTTCEMYWDENNRLIALSDNASWILTFTMLLVFTNGEALLMQRNELGAPLLL